MKSENIIGFIVGGILGIIVWLLNKEPYTPFGIWQLVFVLVCAWGGIYTFGPFIKK